MQSLAVLLIWWAVDALVRAAIEIYEEFDLELPVNTINFVVRPGAAGVGAVTLLRWRKRGVETLAWRRPPV